MEPDGASVVLQLLCFPALQDSAGNLQLPFAQNLQVGRGSELEDVAVAPSTSSIGPDAPFWGCAAVVGAGPPNKMGLLGSHLASFGALYLTSASSILKHQWSLT
jgi:hypothetical protein